MTARAYTNYSDHQQTSSDVLPYSGTNPVIIRQDSRGSYQPPQNTESKVLLMKYLGPNKTEPVSEYTTYPTGEVNLPPKPAEDVTTYNRGPTVVYTEAPRPAIIKQPRYYNHMQKLHRQTLLAVGIVLIVAGIALLLLNIVGQAVYDGNFFTWSGIWLGLWTIVVGAVCARTASAGDVGMVIAALTLSVTLCGGLWWPLDEYFETGEEFILTEEFTGLRVGLYTSMLLVSMVIFLVSFVAAVMAGRNIQPMLMGLTQNPVRGVNEMSDDRNFH